MGRLGATELDEWAVIAGCLGRRARRSGASVRWCCQSRLGPDVTDRLPGSRASRWAVASALVDGLPRDALLSVFTLLLQQRPHCSGKTHEIAQKFGFTPEQCEQASAPAPSREWRLGELIFDATVGVESRWKRLDISARETLGPFTPAAPPGPARRGDADTSGPRRNSVLRPALRDRPSARPTDRRAANAVTANVGMTS